MRYERIRERADAERLMRKEFEWMRWVEEIPYIQFPANWLVRVVPPFQGAVVRFLVREPGGERVSVYLDCYGELGAVDEPYWEVYPSEDGDTARCVMEDVDELLGLIEAGLRYSRQNGADE